MQAIQGQCSRATWVLTNELAASRRPARKGAGGHAGLNCRPAPSPLSKAVCFAHSHPSHQQAPCLAVSRDRVHGHGLYCFGRKWLSLASGGRPHMRHIHYMRPFGGGARSKTRTLADTSNLPPTQASILRERRDGEAHNMQEVPMQRHPRGAPGAQLGSFDGECCVGGFWLLSRERHKSSSRS